MDLHLYGSNIKAMAAAVTDQHEPRPFHVDVFDGRDPTGDQGVFVVATWSWAEQVFMAWEAVGKDGPEQLKVLLRWGGIAKLYGLAVRGGLAHADCWHHPRDWHVDWADQPAVEQAAA